MRALFPDDLVHWSRFDPTEFVSILPNLAYLDVVREGNSTDFVYRFVGENINEIAKTSLRGCRLSSVLPPSTREIILDEYTSTIENVAARASKGRVFVSDKTWLTYVRILFPVKVEAEISRILLLMTFTEQIALTRRLKLQ